MNNINIEIEKYKKAEEAHELVKTLKPITDFSILKKGDKIFNKESLSPEYIDTFDHIEQWSDDRLIVFYYNYKGEYWHGQAEGYWYYI